MKMDNYNIVGSLGEGSFGRVYKAKQLSTNQIVALKVISKRGRSVNEIKELRGECEIQRHLHHPNIIQMLDSFETENEIVVITEFAHKELNTILGEKGYLQEDSVRTIVWDLVSALYYLHSHRVLHRDLKPQNVLLDAKNKAKLCDFGFARNMSTGTHVLTSIKGTPLYMAPELIDELPYDHNADLWSLGCIIYELLVGAPPFCTASILHLIRLIKNEQIQWPTFLSDHCISFLKGLLQKDPKKRLTWTEILNHPWVKGKILILEDDLTMPLTKTLSMNTMNLKDLQRKEHVVKKNSKKVVDEQKYSATKVQNLKECSTNINCESDNNNEEINEKMTNLSLDSKKGIKLEKSESIEESQEEKVELIFSEESHLIETEEWSVFLLKSMEEVMGGEMISLTQENLTNILVSPLKNSTTSPTVVTYIAKLFSIPFVVKGIPKTDIDNMKKVYLKVALVPNLLHSLKLLLRKKTEQNISESMEKFKRPQDLNNEELECLECIMQLICHLVYIQNDFLVQFNDSLTVLNISELLHKFFSLAKQRQKIVLDLVAIITHILKKTPNNSVLVENILHPDEETDYNILNVVNLLRHENALMRERLCYLLLYLGKIRPNTLSILMDENVKETLEALMFDSIEFVRNAAEKCVDELKNSELL